MSQTFDLLEQPWIPVRGNGTMQELSLLQTLQQAQRIERIEDPSPLITVALHRLLLAVLHRALRGPEDQSDLLGWLNDGWPVADIEHYLRKWQHHFNLFDAQHPFYQTRQLDTKAKSIAQLAAELASGTNKLLFDHTTEQQPPALTPAYAARLLVARQMLAIPEGAGYSPSPIGGTALVLAMGHNLHQTLCLNMVPYFNQDTDEPVWESQLTGVDGLQPIRGLTHRYTWVSRLIRLVPDPTDGLVRYVLYGPAAKYDPSSIFEPDPMLAYRITDAKTGERKPLNFRKDRSFWRDFAALLPSTASDPPRVLSNALELYRINDEPAVIPAMVLGATNDRAKFELWRQELHLLPQALSSDQSSDAVSVIQRALEGAENLGKSLNHAARVLAAKLLSRGERSPHKDDVTRMVNSFPTYAAYWSTLDRAFPRLLEGLSKNFDPSQVLQDWNLQLKQAAERAWRLTCLAAGDDAFALRAIYVADGLLQRELASLLPTKPKELA